VLTREAPPEATDTSCPGFPKVLTSVVVTTGTIKANLQHTQCAGHEHAGHEQVASESTTTHWRGMPATAVCVYLHQISDKEAEELVSSLIVTPMRKVTDEAGVVEFPVFTRCAPACVVA
jgi:hypothetical protein